MVTHLGAYLWDGLRDAKKFVFPQDLRDHEQDLSVTPLPIGKE
jgi:hypothetical protein